MEDRIEAARHVVRDFGMGDQWHAAFDAGMPPELERLQHEVVEAFRRADIEWLLEHADPDLEITQPAEIPDARTYHGHDGYIEALLDWPRQWADFQIEPRRVFVVGDDHVVAVTTHRGRPATADIQVEAQIVFLTRWREGRMTHWNMFLTVDEALEAAQARVG
jgi:ketosteroid isomerase-like protein